METFDVKGELIDKIHYSVQTFKVNDFVVTKGSCDYEGSVLTPWNVLSCYLESILQVFTYLSYLKLLYEVTLCNRLFRILSFCVGWICSRDSWKCL